MIVGMSDVKKDSITGRFLLSVWWMVLPLMWWGGWEYGYELPKMLWLLGGSMTLVVVGILSTKRVERWDGLMMLVWLWWLGLAISSWRGIAVDVMWWGKVVRWQGLGFYLSLVGLIMVVSWWRGKLLTLWLTRSWLVAAVLSVGLGLWQQIRWWLALPVASYAGRMVSSFGEPNYWADFLLVGWVWWRGGMVKLKLMWVDGLVGGGLLLSGSRLDIAMFVGVLVWRYLSGKKWKKVVFGVALAGIVLAVVRWGWMDERWIFWQKAAQKIGSRPWMGYGVDTVGQVLEGITWRGAGYWVDRAHNLILDMGVYGGLLVVMLWVGINALALKKSWKVGDMATFWALVIWHILSLIHVVGTVGFVWWGILVGSCVRGKQVEIREMSGWKWLMVGIYGVMVVRLLWLNFGVWMG